MTVIPSLKPLAPAHTAEPATFRGRALTQVSPRRPDIDLGARIWAVSHTDCGTLVSAVGIDGASETSRFGVTYRV